MLNTRHPKSLVAIGAVLGLTLLGCCGESQKLTAASNAPSPQQLRDALNRLNRQLNIEKIHQEILYKGVWVNGTNAGDAAWNVYLGKVFGRVEEIKKFQDAVAGLPQRIAGIEMAWDSGHRLMAASQSKQLAADAKGLISFVQARAKILEGTADLLKVPLPPPDFTNPIALKKYLDDLKAFKKNYIDPFSADLKTLGTELSSMGNKSTELEKTNKRIIELQNQIESAKAKLSNQLPVPMSASNKVPALPPAPQSQLPPIILPPSRRAGARGGQGGMAGGGGSSSDQGETSGGSGQGQTGTDGDGQGGTAGGSGSSSDQSGTSGGSGQGQTGTDGGGQAGTAGGGGSSSDQSGTSGGSGQGQTGTDGGGQAGTAGGRVKPLSNGWCNGDIALCEAWHDEGDRAFDSPDGDDAATTAARQKFYNQNPQLTQFQDVATWSSPATQVDQAIQNGILRAATSPNDDTSGSLSQPSDPNEFRKLLSKAQAAQADVDDQTNSVRKQLVDRQNEKSQLDRDFASAQEAQQQARTVMHTPRIPDNWVPCQCPADHPNAGILVNGVRYHTPLLRCPN